MMDNTANDLSQSPDSIPVPFAGRQAVFERIQQYLIDPSDRHALLYIGRKSIGKSAFLMQCQQVLDANVIACYLPLTNVNFTDESDWLFYLVQQTNQALDAHQLNIARLPPLPDDPQSYRESLTDDYLPEMIKLIRPHRRFVWLVDDAESLIEAIESERLPSDTVNFLSTILESHLQIGIVMTINENNEPQVTSLTPLIDVNRIQRLHPLSQDETTQLIRQFRGNVEDEAMTHIYQLTDGHPLLLQSIGTILRTLYTDPITIKDIDQQLDVVYRQAYKTYHSMWTQTLSQNERLILTAISGLLYDDPLANLTAQRIESWLLETDFPMDITAINAGIRGLDYRNLVVGSTSEGIRLRAKLFQRWLVEHAQMDKPGTWGNRNAMDSDNNLQIDRRSLTVIAILIIAVILIVSVVQQSNTSTSIPVQPTVTLEP